MNIETLRVSAYRIPTDQPESDGTFAWDATTLIVVEAAAGSTSGLGYTYTDASVVRLIEKTLAGHVAERSRRRVDAGHHDSESTQLATHVDALRAAGFAEIGTLWQRGDNRLLCAILPPR